MPLTDKRVACTNVAVIFPPLGVFLERGCNVDLLINVVLCCFGYIPGIIHALYIVSNHRHENCGEWTVLTTDFQVLIVEFVLESTGFFNADKRATESALLFVRSCSSPLL